MMSETAVFGGGCFWCTEAVFQRLQGVTEVTSGYAGGDPTRVKAQEVSYDDVAYRDTGYAEVIRVSFDPHKIHYDDLLNVFFALHDPTTLNQQGNDVGPQYRSLILYTSDEQRRLAEQKIEQLTQDQVFDQPIVTEVEPLQDFHEAEPAHRDYYNRNQQNPYCQVIISPKVAKLRQQFAHLLK